MSWMMKIETSIVTAGFETSARLIAGITLEIDEKINHGEDVTRPLIVDTAMYSLFTFTALWSRGI